MYEDKGVFTYFEDGFMLNYESLTMNIQWNDIIKKTALYSFSTSTAN